MGHTGSLHANPMTNCCLHSVTWSSPQKLQCALCAICRVDQNILLYKLYIMCLNSFLVSTLHDFILCNHSHSVSWTLAKSVSSRYYIISNVNTFNKLKFCNFVSFLQLPNNYFISAKSSASPEKWSKGKPEANKARIQGCNIWKLCLNICMIPQF